MRHITSVVHDGNIFERMSGDFKKNYHDTELQFLTEHQNHLIIKKLLYRDILFMPLASNYEYSNFLKIKPFFEHFMACEISFKQGQVHEKEKLIGLLRTHFRFSLVCGAGHILNRTANIRSIH
jgi:hypothetical protein